jgi:hypothetical protein
VFFFVAFLFPGARSISSRVVGGVFGSERKRERWRSVSRHGETSI